jgi:hypothetical protein
MTHVAADTATTWSTQNLHPRSDSLAVTVRPLRLLTAQAMCRLLPPIFAQRIRHVLYPHRLARRDDHQFMTRAQAGSAFVGTTAFLSYPFAVHGYSHRRNWAIALAISEPGCTLLEVGANWERRLSASRTSSGRQEGCSHLISSRQRHCSSFSSASGYS